MKISIIIPVYHEEKNIKKVLQSINKLVVTQHEIILVYDNEYDPTVAEVKKYCHVHKKLRIFLIKNNIGTKLGVMNAIKTGFINANGEAIVVVMADLADDITQVDIMYGLTKKGYDIVCASRFMKGGRKIGGSVLKSLLSKFAGLSLHAFIGIPTHDATNAFKMYKKKIFKDITIESTGGFEYSLEIITKAYKKGYKITEIPTVWYERVEGKSHFQFISWLPLYIKWYVLAYTIFLTKKNNTI